MFKADWQTVFKLSKDYNKAIIINIRDFMLTKVQEMHREKRKAQRLLKQNGNMNNKSETKYYLANKETGFSLNAIATTVTITIGTAAANAHKATATTITIATTTVMTTVTTTQEQLVVVREPMIQMHCATVESQLF